MTLKQKRQQKSHQPETAAKTGSETATKIEAETDAETVDADAVELASMDSFPASDPPSWIPAHLGNPATATTQEIPEEPAARKANRRANAPADRSSTDEQSALDSPPSGGGRRRPSRQQ